MSGDTESYITRAPARRRVFDTSKGPRALMGEALLSVAPEPVEPSSSVPVIPDSVVQENLRRVVAGARNTLVTLNPDGTRSYRHDVVQRGDGMRDSHGTDRGEGTRDSLKILREEGAVKVEGLLPTAKERDSSGRFLPKDAA